MPSEEYTGIVRRYIEQVYYKGDPTIIGKLIAPDRVHCAYARPA